tara:strand:+ start:794 stop:1099 length:306 start_codon:yes stop_codon:yes gene_type:complete
MGSVEDLSSKNFDEFVRQGTTIVDFWAEWCGPCKVLGPTFKETAAETDIARFGKVDVDSNSDLAARFQVMSIPTLIVFKDGKAVDRKSGALSKEQLIELVK